MTEILQHFYRSASRSSALIYPIFSMKITLFSRISDIGTIGFERLLLEAIESRGIWIYSLAPRRRLINYCCYGRPFSSANGILFCFPFQLPSHFPCCREDLDVGTCFWSKNFQIRISFSIGLKQNLPTTYIFTVFSKYRKHKLPGLGMAKLPQPKDINCNGPSFFFPSLLVSDDLEVSWTKILAKDM